MIIDAKVKVCYMVMLHSELKQVSLFNSYVIQYAVYSLLQSNSTVKYAILMSFVDSF